MLESLSQGAGTIHELNLAGAFPARAPYRPRELYAALKDTPLYDPERGQWNHFMSMEQELGDGSRYASTLLLGVLVEAQFNAKGAQALYEELKATPLYDSACGQWNLYMSLGQQMRGGFNSEREGFAQLLGVLAEEVCDPEGARARYEKLKTTPLYTERGYWNTWMSEEQEQRGRELYAEVQLLGVLVAARGNPAEASARYSKLKTTAFYDAARRQWNASFWSEEDLCASTATDVLGDTDRFAVPQLLGVLAEAQFNPEAARALYEELKASPLYDPERGQWNRHMSEKQILEDTDRYAYAQLLGVLVEAKLLSVLAHPLTEAVPPLPITEDW